MPIPAAVVIAERRQGKAAWVEIRNNMPVIAAIMKIRCFGPESK